MFVYTTHTHIYVSFKYVLNCIMRISVFNPRKFEYVVQVLDWSTFSQWY